jgi:hypothetical protein
VKDGAREKSGLFMELYRDNGYAKAVVVNDYINDIFILCNQYFCNYFIFDFYYIYWKETKSFSFSRSTMT